jgi:Sulfotransferase domain
MRQGPHFIIIGAMKCATSSLHEQLASQPGFFMSTPKEPCYFSDDENYAKGFEWYYSLFASAFPSNLCGESSTHYTKLPTYPKTLERMQSALPQLKLIYIVRQPIDRLISQYIHEQTQRRVDATIDVALDRHPELIAYSRYSMQLKPYLSAYGSENVLLVFFERLVKHPQEELERICRFLSYEGQPRWDETRAMQNVSSERLRRSALRDALVETPVLKAIRVRFIPKSWRNQIRSLWQIKERPVLSEKSLQRLRETFDRDLEQLGQWLGVELSCSNFRELAMTVTGDWASVVESVVH